MGTLDIKSSIVLSIALSVMTASVSNARVVSGNH